MEGAVSHRARPGAKGQEALSVRQFPPSPAALTDNFLYSEIEYRAAMGFDFYMGISRICRRRYSIWKSPGRVDILSMSGYS